MPRAPPLALERLRRAVAGGGCSGAPAAAVHAALLAQVCALRAGEPCTPARAHLRPGCLLGDAHHPDRAALLVLQAEPAVWVQDPLLWKSEVCCVQGPVETPVRCTRHLQNEKQAGFSNLTEAVALYAHLQQRCYLSP